MKKRGAITLVFDDGYRDVLEQVVPLLDKYNISGVFAIPLSPAQGMISGEKIAPLQDWKNIATKHGHELAGHGVTHRNLAQLSAEDMNKEVRESKEQLHATTIIYPGGAYTDEVLDTAKKYFTAGRTVGFGLETLPPERPFELKTINYTKNNFSLARANTYALIAWMRDRWLIETFHMVRSKHSNMKHFVYLDDLEAHLDFITSLPIQIATIADTIKTYAK